MPKVIKKNHTRYSGTSKYDVIYREGASKYDELGRVGEGVKIVNFCTTEYVDGP